MQSTCILQHLIMNTKHKQHVKSHIHTRTHIRTRNQSPKSGLCFSFSLTFLRTALFCQLIPPRLNFKVTFLCTIAHQYHTLVSSTARSPPGMDASGWLVCLAAGRSPAATSTWPEFSAVEGYNSSKVAAQTIVYTTAH